mmetsp:Transcript_1117/g.2249  ORF Transcript_1117/g.2249 Transcript_1117/m.2249 type:complete len:82 (-) Transcript_1117:894-1139(-)|eukprot:scaffold8790_cov187-Amphora_coffeaeformis.AAC.5
MTGAHWEQISSVAVRLTEPSFHMVQSVSTPTTSASIHFGTNGCIKLTSKQPVNAYDDHHPLWDKAVSDSKQSSMLQHFHLT